MKILFVNACVRSDSRTRKLASHFLKGLAGNVTEVNLEKENLLPLKKESLTKRETLVRQGKLNDASFRYAHEFAEADMIVIAAPYWDLSFPSLLKIYLESVTVSGITFQYSEEGIPITLCRAKQLIYITTAGGTISTDFGCSYVKQLAESFYGIHNTVCFKAENLDVIGQDKDAILEQAKKDIDKFLEKDV